MSRAIENDGVFRKPIANAVLKDRSVTLGADLSKQDVSTHPEGTQRATFSAR